MYLYLTLTYIHGWALSLDVVVDVGGSEREEGRAAGAEQQLRQHEEQHGHHVAARALDAVVGFAILDAVVRA